jgi:3-oxoadipate enol-lactonase
MNLIEDKYEIQETQVGDIFARSIKVSTDLPWVALLMGYSGSSDSWGPRFISEVCKHANLVLIDNRGTGRSKKEKETGHFTVELFARDAIDVLEHFGEKYHLAGLSLGGCIAQTIAHIKPSLLTSLSLISTTSGGDFYVPPVNDMLERLAAPEGDTVFEKSLSLWGLCMDAEDIKKNIPELEAIHELQMLNLTPRSTFKGQMIAFRKFRNTDSSNIPTQIITGDKDRLMPPENSEKMKNLYTNCSLRILPGVEHMPFIEDSTVLAQMITDFARTHK